MTAYKLILGPDGNGSSQEALIETDDLARLFCFVERQKEFDHAEIWREEQLICQLEFSAVPKGRIWKVMHPPRAPIADFTKKNGLRPVNKRAPLTRQEIPTPAA